MNPELLLLLLGELFAKSTAILLLAALIVQVWQGASAAQRHFVWLAAIVLVLLLPLTRLVTPHWGIPVAGQAALKSTLILPPEISSLDESAPPISALPAKASQPSPAWQTLGWQTILLSVWLAGCVGTMGYRILGLCRLRRLEKHRLTPADAHVEAMATIILAEMKIRRPVRVRLSEDCQVPMTWGFRHPILVLPAQAFAWSDARLAAALRHEAGHIARHDYPVRWIAHLACSVYWLNPLVWLAARSLRIAQEQATDDLVLQAGTPPEDYATQLFDSARLVAAHGIFARHAVAMATPSTLESRVLAIVDEQRDRRPLSQITATLGSLAILLTFALCTVAQLQGASPEPAPSPADKKAPVLTARQRAEHIIIPKVEFREVALAEAVEFLRSQSRALSPDGQDVKIVVNAPPQPIARINLSLTNIPLIEAVTYVAGLSNLAVDAQPEALFLVTAPAATATSVPPRSKASGAVMKRAEEIILPKIEFKVATVAEAVDVIREKARESDPDKAGVNIILQPGVTTDARITVSLTNIPLSEMLRYLAGLANLELRELSEANAVELAPKVMPAMTALTPIDPSKIPASTAAAQPLQLTADRVTHDKDGSVTAEGHAQVRSGTAHLTADKVRMKEQSRFVEATGRVEILNGSEKTTGEHLMVGFRDNGSISIIGPHQTIVITPPTNPSSEKGGASNSVTPPAIQRVSKLGDMTVDPSAATKPSRLQEPAAQSPVRIRLGAEIQVSSSIIDRKPIGRRPGEN